MVRLVRGVARCTPIGTQRATNGVAAQLATQQLEQRGAVSHREAPAANAQQPVQPVRNSRATQGPVLNPQKLRAVADGEAELRDLIGRVLDDPEEREEALAVGTLDLEAALTSYRLLDARTSDSARGDSRRRCDQCRNLSDEGRCRAAWRGEPLGYSAPRTYHPVVMLPQHCAGFKPFGDDSDQRTGHDRWPSLTNTRCADPEAGRG
jgi:hypothetical protein